MSTKNPREILRCVCVRVCVRVFVCMLECLCVCVCVCKNTLKSSKGKLEKYRFFYFYKEKSK